MKKRSTLITKIALMLTTAYLSTTILGAEFQNQSIDDELDNWCKTAQIQIGNLSPDEISPNTIVNTIHDNRDSFGDSKPKIANGKIEIHTFFNDKGHIWCKLKKQKAILKSNLRIKAHGEERQCRYMNEMAFNTALDLVDEDMRDQFLALDINIDFKKDKEFTTGFGWINTDLSFKEVSQNNYQLRSPTLKTSYYFPVLGGMYYCKMISVEGALNFIEESIR